MCIREKLEANLPRLVVQFNMDDKGGENYSWGTVGSIPLFTLVGAIVKAESDLASNVFIPDSDTGNPAEPLSFVIFWDAVAAEVTFYNSHEIPAESLLGMLEVIKIKLIGDIVQRHNAPQKRLLGPDGKPIR